MPYHKGNIGIYYDKPMILTNKNYN